MPRRKKTKELKEIEQRRAKYLGKKLRFHRTEARYTLDGVSKKADVSTSTLSEYERGLYPCPPDRLRELATLYNAPLSDFSIDPSEGLSANARQLAEILEQWDEKDQEEVMRAVIRHLSDLRRICDKQITLHKKRLYQTAD